jgi:hypothetical protein
MAFKPLEEWEIQQRGDDIAHKVEAIEDFDVLFNLYALGDKLASDANVSLRGIEALHYEMVIRHDWLPSVVRELPPRDIELVFRAELDSLELPAQYEGWRRKALNYFWQHNQARNRRTPDPT